MTRDERLAYSRGYSAGRSSVQSGAAGARARKGREDAFWRDVLLASLPEALASNGWVRGSQPISELADRVRLAAEIATAALNLAKEEGRLP